MKLSMKEKVDAGYSRLHITPFDPQLLKVIVPPAVLPKARRISYHALQTFPDKLYGFVDLPTDDAVKIKNKLNGATLRGARINIEPARPDTMPDPSPDAIVAVDAVPTARKPKPNKRDKKRKRDNLEIAGVELEDGRKVKRGWTVTSNEAQTKKNMAKDQNKKQGKPRPKDDEKRQKKRHRQDPESRYIDGPEALVRTRLPPNKVDASSTGGDKKKSKRKSSHLVVHEFENNTKFATFLKAAQPTPVTGREGTSFVEGKGWVDKDGNILEEVKSTRPRMIPKLPVDTMAAHPRASADDDDDNDDDDDDDDTSSGTGTSFEEDGPDAGSPVAAPVTEQPEKKAGIMLSSLETKLASSVVESDPERPKSSGSMRSLTIRIPPTTPTPGTSKVHPLEALYKRQVPGQVDDAAPNQSPADFKPFTFGAGQDNDLEEDEGQDCQHRELEDIHGQFQGSRLPMTPYSKQDFDWRNTRSAAPTPDTAHPSRISRLWSIGGDDELQDVQEDREEDGEHSLTGQNGRVEEDEGAGEDTLDPSQDFQKWFWNNRGNLDRAWRKRRREAAKAKRYRENKAKEDRAI